MPPLINVPVKKYIPFNASFLQAIDSPNTTYPKAGDFFGYTIALDGNTAVVVATGDTDTAPNGVAYVIDVSTGQVLQTLLSGAGDSYFGLAAGISGNRAILSTWTAGACKVFDISTGSVLHTINNPNIDTSSVGMAWNDGFTNDVAIHGDYALVGAVYEDPGGSSDAGAAYIFDMVSGDLSHTLLNPLSVPGQYFGQYLAVSDQYALVSAHHANGGYGAVCVFDVTTGGYLRALTTGDASSYFGMGISISGDLAAVGEPWWGSNAGRVHVFRVSTGEKLFTFVNPDVSDLKLVQFGQTVSLAGKYLAIGGSGQPNPPSVNANYSGKVYIYDVTTGLLLQEVLNPNAYGTQKNDYFGMGGHFNHLAISSQYLVVGAHQEDYDSSNLDAGKAYIYQL